MVGALESATEASNALISPMVRAAEYASSSNSGCFVFHLVRVPVNPFFLDSESHYESHSYFCYLEPHFHSCY